MPPTQKVILVAEDDDNDFMLIRRAASQADAGLSLIRVRDGVEVTQYLSGSEDFQDRDDYPLPSLLLLDLKMPRKNGFDVLEWIRRHPTLRSLIVVVLSSSQSERDIQQAGQLGANSYLTKPSSYLELVEMVKVLTRYWLDYVQHPRFNP